jgi:acetyl esterase/lipase
MTDDELTPERVAALTAAVDIDAPPPSGEPVALVLFGTNRAAPAQVAAARDHAGAAPLVIATGGINRHNGIIEGREFARQLTQAGVPDSVIRVEDQSKDTWQNVELSLPTCARRWPWGCAWPWSASGTTCARARTAGVAWRRSARCRQPGELPACRPGELPGLTGKAPLLAGNAAEAS